MSLSRDQRDLVSRIVRYQIRRGPDDQSVEVARGQVPVVVFGHDRLSILDLSRAANQPFWSADRRYCLTFNGEIYNYREVRDELRKGGKVFHTQSDTEVLVEAFATWGVDAIERFNGMFAFAISDTQSGTVWLVRDRFGVKPLFYACPNPQEVWFASTAGEICRELKLEPDYGYLADGIRWLVYEDGSGRTQFKNLMAVEPGCYIEITQASGALHCETRRYYDLRERVERRQAELREKSEQDLIDVTEQLLRDAVRLRLRADVPVGVSLSGGIDSSLVACLAVQEGADITGVSFGNPNRNDTEGPLVKAIANHARIDVQYVWPAGDVMREAVWEALRAQEAPFPSLSIVAQHLVFRSARAIGLKVMLGGQGADEAFMGYRKYLYMTVRRRERTAGIVGDLAGIGKVVGCELIRLRRNIADLRRYRSTRLRVLDVPGSNRVLGMNGFREARWRQLRDVVELSLPTLLRYEDRSSMGNSVESRLPFMDYRVIETGLALPDRLKVRNGYCKWILRRIAGRLLPELVTRNRLKNGFEALTSEWIRLGVGHDIRARLAQVAATSVEGFGTQLLRRPLSDELLANDEQTLCEALTAIWLNEQRRVGHTLPHMQACI